MIKPFYKEQAKEHARKMVKGMGESSAYKEAILWARFSYALTIYECHEIAKENYA